MTSLGRKIKRKQQQKLFRDFKKSMKKFKEQVRCSKCGRDPAEKEKIDSWRLDEYSDNINLICTECCVEGGHESDDESI